jgi:predicted DNA-binding transcriptional regulator AlpA
MRVLRYEEAAQRAGLVRRSLERLIAKGEGPSIIHVSQRRRGVLESDLEHWLLSRRHAAPGDVAPDEPAERSKLPPAKIGAPQKSSSGKAA